MASLTTITLEELRRRLKGNGLVTEGEGVFRSDHILLQQTTGDRFLVRAVSRDEADGLAVVARLRRQLADVANVAVETAPHPFRNAS